MIPFVHLHVHSQYSVLDGQASVTALVDKAIADGQAGLALTDHGNMFGIKEFFNYVKKKQGKFKGELKDLNALLDQARAEGKPAEEISAIEADIAKLRKKLAFKPIFGCEMYVAKNSLHDKTDKTDKGRHLIVLAKNQKGYKNLIKLVSKAWTEGAYFHPRTDKTELEKHKEGLIVCSACIGGEIPQHIMQGDITAAEKSVQWFKSVFGDDYYIELQRHKATVVRADHSTYEKQCAVNKELIRIAEKYAIKLICTNDVHFVNESDAEAHERLLCVSTGRKLSDENRMLYTKQEWMKTQEEMNQVFGDMPETLSNTLEILDKVETYDIDHAPIMPNFEIPADFGTEEEYRRKFSEKDLFDEFTRDENGNVVLSQEDAEAKINKLGGYDKLYRIKFEADYLKKLAYEGATKRYGENLSDELKERIKFELHIMKTMGFPGYFLIVQDFINVARNQLGVSVGPGRGSAAGSAVAYCLGITQIDPVKYDLLFERFLNPDRISLPDIDIDFDDDGRAIVLKYVTEKYGEEKVAHIITYGTMATKSAIKDVARVEDLPLSESNRLANLVPRHLPEVNGKEPKMTLANCLKYDPGFQQELVAGTPLVKETLKYAEQLEGNVRNTGVHACGVIICRDDITDWVPVSTAIDKTDGRVLVTQYEGRVIEETGLIKMDFLGLKTLSIIKEAVENIKLARNVDIDIDTIPIDDPKTYQLYCEGRTTGTFQFESAGMQKYLRELQPSTFEDLIAMNALYRPGPMDYIPDFIARKHGKSPIVYDIPVMEKYLKDTYGVTVYQEQVMLLSRLLANFTRGQSDTLRKAMGKKMIAKMNELKGKFLEGGKANGHDESVLNKIWADWEKFASYAFNKSHATCYSWVAFQTAYLKANYPAEYMAAVLSRNRTDITKLTTFMDECKALRIKVLGPDVNESFSSFGVNRHGDIRFGIAAIKGVGENVAADIIKARMDGGPFTSIYDFVERVPLASLNRRTFESLALAGAFDCFKDVQREDYFEKNSRDESLSELLIRYGQSFQNAKNNQFASLFGDEDVSLNTAGRPAIKPAIPWLDVVRLEKEKELVGMFLSGHPLDPFFMELNYGCSANIKAVNEGEYTKEDKEFTIGGLVVGFEERPTKKGGMYGRIKIEDYTGVIELMLFGQDYIKFANFGKTGTPVYVHCKFEKGRFNDELRLKVVDMRLLEDVKGQIISQVTINTTVDDLNDALSSLMQEQINSSTQNRGNLNFRVFHPQANRYLTLTSGYKIPLDKRLVNLLNDLDLEFSFN